MNPRRRRPGEISHTAIMIALVVAATLTAFMVRLVHNMATLADFLSILAIPIALSIYRLAGLFAERSRAAHESTLRETDKRDIKHAEAMTHTCRSVALGISRSSAISSPNVLILTQNLAITIGTVVTQHGHLLTKRGQRAAERARNAASLILESGNDCLAINASCMAQDLKILSNSVLSPDDESLVERRRRAAGADIPA